MAIVAISTVVFTGLAVLVLRWARTDLDERTWLSSRSILAAWLLYVSHADTVASAAWIGLLRVDVPESAAFAVGGAVGVAGLGLFIAATGSLVRHGDMDGPRSQRLVTTGAYRLMRNPQNVGWGLLLAGCAIAGRSLVAAALVALFAAFISRYTRYEERHLTQAFGGTHTRYLATTPAGLRPWRPGT